MKFWSDCARELAGLPRCPGDVCLRMPDDEVGSGARNRNEMPTGMNRGGLPGLPAIRWCARHDSNVRLVGYEPTALAAKLHARQENWSGRG